MQFYATSDQSPKRGAPQVMILAEHIMDEQREEPNMDISSIYQSPCYTVHTCLIVYSRLQRSIL